MLKGLNLPVSAGVLVDSVQPGSPAAKAGIKGGDIPAQVDGATVRLGGDIIVEVDGKKITTSQSLTSAIAAKRKGDTVKITLVRGGKKRTISVTLAERPQDAPSGVHPAEPGAVGPTAGDLPRWRRARPRIKICGITGARRRGARRGAAAPGRSASSSGPGSPRACEPRQAELIAAHAAAQGRGLRRVRQRAARRGHRPSTRSG